MYCNIKCIKIFKLILYFRKQLVIIGHYSLFLCRKHNKYYILYFVCVSVAFKAQCAALRRPRETHDSQQSNKYNAVGNLARNS